MGCEEKQQVVTRKAEEMAKRLQEKSKELGDQIRSRTKGIAPDIDTEGADVWFNADIRIDWKLVEFSLDLPEITLRDERIKMHLPQVTIKDQDIIFDTPSVRMVTRETGRYPETVCRMVTKDIGFGIKTDIPECTVTFSPIFMDLPEVFMEQQRIRMGIPEFRMDLTEFVLGIPQFAMRTQKFSLHLPEITVKDIQVEARIAQEKGNALAQESRMRAETLKAEFQETAKLELSVDAKEMFYCYEQQFVTARNTAMASFESGISNLQSSIASMAASKVPEDNATLVQAKASLADLLARRDEFAKKIESDIRDLQEKQATFFEKFIGNAAAPVAGEKAA